MTLHEADPDDDIRTHGHLESSLESAIQSPELRIRHDTRSQRRRDRRAAYRRCRRWHQHEIAGSHGEPTGHFLKPWLLITIAALPQTIGAPPPTETQLGIVNRNTFGPHIGRHRWVSLALLLAPHIWV